jgi:hypothetical protein
MECWSLFEPGGTVLPSSQSDEPGGEDDTKLIGDRSSKFEDPEGLEVAQRAVWNGDETLFDKHTLMP